MEITSQLVYMYDKIFVPDAMRIELINLLHGKFHLGINILNQALRRLYFWPGISNQVHQKLQSCKECIFFADNKPKNVYFNKSYNLKQVFDLLTMDVASFNGKDFLVVTDKFSGMVFVIKFFSPANTDQVIQYLKTLFYTFGASFLVNRV